MQDNWKNVNLEADRSRVKCSRRVIHKLRKQDGKQLGGQKEVMRIGSSNGHKIVSKRKQA